MTQDPTAGGVALAASSEKSVPAWRGRDLALGLVILSSLIAIQALLFATGVWSDRGLGFRAEIYRFFPTVLTGYGVLWMARRRGMTLGDLGFNRHPILWPAFVAWLVAMLSGPIFIGLLSLASIGSGRFRLLFIPAVLMLGVGMVVIAPVVEEITFRGLLFRGLRQRWPLPPAALLSGLVFASFHLSAETLLPLTLTGIAVAWAYDRTGSIWAAILPHAGLNALVFLKLVTDRA
ncbi:MAG: CPBP family intramembrane metalloprotease [Dehalococcoidia bacterium]|jgi:uncharacterized protein|nr:CPBP family intramembrane metalloprotease [Dehalococcoidia bacterium]